MPSRSLNGLLILLSVAGPLLAQPLDVASGDRILLYGNSFIERMQEHGWFEARMQLAHPDHNLTFRSMAWTGDEAEAVGGGRLRNFVDPDGNMLQIVERTRRS